MHPLWCSRQATVRRPGNPSYALNFVHALELEQAYEEAIEATITFCNATEYVTLSLAMDADAACAVVGQYIHMELTAVKRIQQYLTDHTMVGLAIRTCMQGMTYSDSSTMRLKHVSGSSWAVE